jgi:serine/threonine protein phosphatase PrpC
MGCTGSKDNDTQVETSRRRLSVGNVDSQAGGESSDDGGEGDRGLITALNAQNIIQLINSADESGGQGGGRKMSVGSNTDAGKTSFANKTVQQLGDDLVSEEGCLGYTCRKGLKPESPNQDSWLVLKVESNYSIYGVFDGHGQKGHDVSNFVKDSLPKLIVQDPRFSGDDEEQKKGMLIDSFKKTQSLISTLERQKRLSASMSGTTATVVIHDLRQNKLLLSHVADSTCVLGKKVKDSDKLVGEALTRDHKPNNKDEKARIERAGGRVVFDGYANHRIYAKNARYPGLNMSRCLGDLLGHADCGIIAEPEVSVRSVHEDDRVLLLCSDGVWEFISPTEAVNIVNEFEPSKAMAAAERLAKEAWDRWIKEEGGAVVDDITVVLIYLNPGK